MFSTGLGHEMPAMLAIIAAFMAGMALGAAFIDRFIPRSARTGLWLCGLELTIGAWAVLVSFLVPHANEFALQLIGLAPNAVKHWLIAFSIPAIVLLPATAAMGATFPAMEKFLSALAPKDSSIGSVYGANTFGAVAGTLLAPYLLMPALGFAKSAWVFAAFNTVVGLGCLALARLQGPATERPRERDQPPQRVSRRDIAVTLFLTGLFGIGYEAAGVRVLSQVLENTIYTYAAVLAVFLAGNAAGAASYHRWWRHLEATRLLGHLLNAVAVASLLGVSLMAQTQAIYESARRLGDSMPAVLMAEFITAGIVFALPTFFMGAVFSHLVQLARAMRGRIGDVVALNTLGAALAPVLCLMLLPALRCKWTLIAIGVGYACVPILFKLPRSWLPLVIVVALLLACISPLRFVEAPSGGRIAELREGIMASVAVLADADGHRTLRVDNRFQMGGTAAADAEYRQTHLPLLLHPAPKRALFLGLGTGISFGAASLYPELKADGVELVPEVAEVMPAFAPENFSPSQQLDLKVHIADARRFVRSMTERYDVIVGDVFHPYRDGAGALYTQEHFTAIRARLAANGLFCQWLPLHQLDEATLRVITRTFLDAFPNAEAWLLRFNVEVPVVALIGWNAGQQRSTNLVESRLGESPLATELRRLGLADSLRLYGHLLSSSEDLRAFANSAPLGTDDNQRVTFMAPRLSYQRQTKPYASLLALLAASNSDRAVTLLAWRGEEDFTKRFSQYIAARNIYLRGLVHNAEDRRDEAIDAYIESARLSPEFTAGYAQCLSIATVIANSDPERAKAILRRLIEAQPARPVAREMLERLFAK